MKIRVTLGIIPFRYSELSKQASNLKHIQALFFEEFGERNPRSGDNWGTCGYPAFEFDAAVDDPETTRRLTEFRKKLKAAQPKAVAVVRRSLTAEEIKSARFLEPYYSSSYIADPSLDSRLNVSMFLCQKCKWPNLAQMPDRLLVDKSVLKSYDVFHTGLAMLVVRPRVLELLKDAVGQQVRHGRAELAPGKGKSPDPGPLFWVRPTGAIGVKQQLFGNPSECEACKRTRYYDLVVDDYVNRMGPGVWDDCLKAQNFGSTKLDIALLPDGTGRWPEIVVSGALFAYLKKNGVKGLAASLGDLPTQCIFSAKGEPPLETEPRHLNGPTIKPKKSTRSKTNNRQNAELVKSIRNVPWDCRGDGFIYFYLSGPSFVVMDPMTGEEDTGGPYWVKNFKRPGLYRLPVSAIKNADEEQRGVAVDSGTLVFVDNEFLPALLEHYEWEKAHNNNGSFVPSYLQRVAEKVGSRFGVCSVPPERFKSDFEGDGFYRIDVKRIKPA